MKVGVYGFYQSKNLGDDAFIEAIKIILGKKSSALVSSQQDDLSNFRRAADATTEDITLDFRRAVDMTVEEVRGFDAVVVGGGDLMNDFFGAKFLEVLPSFPGYKIALGVGFSYEVCLRRPYVRLFDDVVIRAPQDLPALSKQIGSAHAHALPDLTFALPVPLSLENKGKIVGFFLVDSLRKQRGFFFAVCSLICWLLSVGYAVELFSMCTDPAGDDDREINRRVEETFAHTGKVKNHGEMSLSAFLEAANGLSLGVCARFHAHIFCARLGVPFVSLPITRKAQLLMEEIPDEGAKIAPVIRDGYLPVSFETEGAKEAILALEREGEAARGALLRWAAEKGKIYHVTNKIKNLVANGRKRQVGASRESLVEPEEIYQKYLRRILQAGINPLTDKLAEAGEAAVSRLAEDLCYDLTLDPANDYVYGTKVNLAERTETLRDMIYWIHGTESGKRKGARLNFNYMKQDSFRGLHRSGWQFAMDGIAALGDDHGILCDTYLDRTFGWACGLLSRDGILPYTNSWVGFFHHTFEKEFAPLNNLSCVFSNPSFLASLPFCRGIFALSEHLAEKVRGALREAGHGEVRVCALRHPTEFPRINFSAPAFLANPDKKLVNVGAWYRNPVTIHTVRSRYLRPASLRGKRMGANFPPEELRARGEGGKIKVSKDGNIWAQYWEKLLEEDEDFAARVLPWADGETNLREVEEVKEFIGRVEVIETLGDRGYDQLLSRNVVFLDLVDASAANTIIECIVRATPLVVRRIPPVEEALGKSYPLFWERREEIPSLLTEEKILEAHRYLLEDLDVEDYRVESFYLGLAGSDIMKE